MQKSVKNVTEEQQQQQEEEWLGFRCGLNMETWRQGDNGTWVHGDRDTGKYEHADMNTWGIMRFGDRDINIWYKGNIETGKL